MRVVHLQRSGGISGSERHLLTLLPALRRAGIDVHFVAMRVHATPGEFEQAMRESGIPTTGVPARSHADPRLLRDLRDELRRLRPDLVHTHLVHADVWGALAATSLRIPHVTSLHGGAQRHLTTFNRLILRLVYVRARAVVCISEHVARFAIDARLASVEKVHVVKYGLPQVESSARDEAAPSAAKEARRAGAVVLVASRLIPRKGHGVLLRAWAEVAPAFPDAELVIAGDGPLRPDLERAAQQLGVGESVNFVGHRRDVDGLYATSDIVVFPTEQGFGEGFGLVNLEAMQHALPVVASAVDSVPEIVADEVTGLLVPPGDATALAGGLRRLLGDPAMARAFGRAGALRASSEFSCERMVARTVAVYRTLATKES